MGCVPTITATSFPKQGSYLGRRVKILYHYNQEGGLGTIIRDDAEEPHRTIIKTDDNRYILATECQYQPI